MTLNRAARGEAITFIKSAILLNTNQCILWPFSIVNSGYGKLKYKGKMKLAHRLSFEMFYKSKIPLGMECAHDPITCKSKRCVNPNHLRAATKSENQADRHIRGTALYGEKCQWSKLTERDVLKIRLDDRMNTVIGKEYGISDQHVSRIKNRKRWVRL